MLKPLVAVVIVVGTGNGTSLGFDLSAFAISILSWARIEF
jgi:hypothetical protein